MNVPCSRCGCNVYPAEKLVCIDQTWHKSCFHCEVCRMILTVNNFVSHQKKPYCQAHNPKNNKFTSVLETPMNLNVKKQTESSEVGKHCQTNTYVYKSLMKLWSVNGVLKKDEVIPCVFLNPLKADYKHGHEERISHYTSIADTPELLRAKAGGRLASNVNPYCLHILNQIKYHEEYEKHMKGKWSQAAGAEVAMAKENGDKCSQYTEEYEAMRGKGSFPAMITPAYCTAKKANELASDLHYKKDFQKMKGAAHYHTLTAEENLVMKRAQDVNKLFSEKKYKKDLEASKGYSVNYCETPQFKNDAKLSKFTSDLKYKEAYQNQMRGHYEGVGMDRRTLHCMKAGSLASNVSRYKANSENDKSLCYYPADVTPSYRAQKKLIPLKDVYYRQRAEKLKFTSVANTPELVRARINAQQLSNLNYRADYEKTKTQFTLPVDVPQLVKAKANADLFSNIKYKEFWEKNKGKGFEMKLDSIALLAAKASGDLASDIKYREAYEKTKDKAVGSKEYDSKTLHSLQVSKMSSEVQYKRDFEQTKTKFHLPMDMVNLTHAKKAQALASDLDYRTKLHEYTLLAGDMKVEWAKKAYGLLSEVGYRADLTWMKGVGWEAERSLNVEQAKKAGDILSEVSKQLHQPLLYNAICRSLQKKTQYQSIHLIIITLMYKANNERTIHQYSISKEEPLFTRAKANAQYLSDKIYKSSWDAQKEKSFELRLDSLALLEAKAKQDLASDIKYREEYEKTKGKLIGVQDVKGDTQMAHSIQASKLQSDLEYRKDFEATKTKFHLPLDMLQMIHAKRAQSMASDMGYRERLHHYTVLPQDMTVEWAKRVYAMQSDNQYRSDLNWMRGIGWMTSGSLDVEQARRAGEAISEKKYRQHPHTLKFTSVSDTPEMIQAKISYHQAIDRLYREDGENVKHHYTLTKDLPELLLAKANARNISETRYKESWTKLRDTGYKLLLDAIPLQAAKASREIVSDYKYKEAFEKTKGHLLGTQKLEDDLNISHSVHAAKLNSDLKYRQGFEETKTHFHLPMDMVTLVHAKKAQALASDQDYKHLIHHYTTLPDDMTVRWAKRAYNLQSENLYRSDLSFMRGVPCISTGALSIEGAKGASELISEKKYRQHPCTLKFTQVTDSPDLLHAKFSNLIANERLYKAAGEDVQHHYTPVVGSPENIRARINAANFSEVKYKQSWLNQRALGYKLTLEAIPFQSAKTSRDIASDYQYKHAFVKEKGKHIGARSILDDPKMLHCLQVAKLQSEKRYKKGAQESRSQFHLPMDMVNLVHARNAQALASDLGYKNMIHTYTMLPDDLKMQWAKKAYKLQSETQYKSDLNFLRGVAWLSDGSPQIETVKRAGELISEKKYRQHPDTLKFTSVVDSANMVHAKSSYLQCNDRLYRSGDAESMYRCTIPPDHPDFKRARMNAQNISEKAYRTSWEQTRALGYDLRLDAIPFQTAKASREIASDYKYKQAFVREKGQQIGFRSIEDDTKMKHFLAASKLQSSKAYKKQFEEGKTKYKLNMDQPGFTHAKRSQEQASNINYRQHLHQWTCDSEQLNVKHAKEAYKLQSDVAYKSDLNWIRGIGWTPPGYHKVEVAKYAAEMSQAEGLDPQEAAIQYERFMVRKPGVSSELAKPIVTWE
uniref:Nebulin-related anchoring protein n=1 Tax=Callorhinchus milii TaxID=7868 RepID=A0A4W3I3G8_CALMI